MTSPTSDSHDLGSDSSLNVRCPYCQEKVRVETEVDWSDVTCLACGSSFGLVGPEAEGGELGPGNCVGRFELMQQLGLGGFGSVWEALDPQLDRTVALKVPRRGELTAAEAELFLREARSAAQIRHPHIVGIHEVGRDGDRIYMVSDLVVGESLAQRLKRERYSLRQAVALTATLADALHHVHENHVVHRDLKPANILLEEDGKPYLTDFGLARRLAGDMTLTCDGQIVGTPAYMSPEQARGDSRSADRLSDIFSLGVIFYELLTGDVPFRGTPRAIVHQLLQDVPRSPRRLNPRVSRDMETICLKCLDKEPARRYQTALALAEDLQRVQRGEPIAARPVGAVVRAARWSRRRPFAAALAATLMLVAMVAPIAALAYRNLARQEAAARETAELSERQRREELYVAKMAAVQHACEANDMLRAGQLLASLVPEPTARDLRGFEWYYWKQQTRRGLLWELGPFEPLHAVAVDPNGALLAFGGSAGTVTLKDLRTDETHELQLTDERPPPKLYSLAFSPDSRWLAMGTASQNVLVMNTATREIERELPTEGGWIEDLEFSADGSLLAAALHQGPDADHQGGRIELWTDLDPGTHRVIPVTDHTVRSLAMSRDGKRIATVGGLYFGQRKGELHLLDVENATTLAKRITELKHGWGVRFSADETSLYTYARSEIQVLEAATLDLKTTFPNDTRSFIGPIAIAPDHELLVAGGRDGALVSWSLPAGQPAESWPGHLDHVMDISMFPDGRQMVTCSYDGFVKCWDPHVSDETLWLTGLPVEIRWLQFSSDGKTVYLNGFSGQQASLQARDTESGKLLWEIQETAPTVACLAPRGPTLILGMSNGEVQFVDASSGKIIERLQEHRPDRFIESVCVSPNGRWLATGDGRAGRFSDTRSEEILLWDLRTRQVVRRWPAHDRRVGLLLFGPADDELVSYGWDKCIRRWRLTTGEQLAEYAMQRPVARGLALTNDQQTLVAVDASGSLWRWSLPDDEQQAVIRSREGTARAALMDQPDRTLIIPMAAVGGDSNQRCVLKFVDTRTWEAKMILDVAPGGRSAIAISPDGTTLLASDEAGNVYRWRVDRANDEAP